jgi:hypothetical protein
MTSRRALTTLALAVLLSATTVACTGDSDTPAGREGSRGEQTAEPS